MKKKVHNRFAGAPVTLNRDPIGWHFRGKHGKEGEMVMLDERHLDYRCEGERMAGKYRFLFWLTFGGLILVGVMLAMPQL